MKLPAGPIPLKYHALVEPFGGLFLIAAPWIFGYNDDTAALVISLTVGGLILVSGALTKWPYALAPVLPLSTHWVTDLLLGVALIVSPFIFGFADTAAPAAIFFTLGGLTLLGLITDNWRDPWARPAGRRAPAASRARSTTRKKAARKAPARAAAKRSGRTTARRTTGTRSRSSSRRTSR